MVLITLLIFEAAFLLLVERVRLVWMRLKVKAMAARCRSIFPDDWRRFVGEWIELKGD
jgi:hypothetical protein